MSKEEFSREFGKQGVWRNYISLTSLEDVVSSIVNEKHYTIKQKENVFYPKLWTIQVGDQTYLFKKETDSKTDKDKEYPTMEYEKFSFTLTKNTTPHLQFDTHASFGSTYDGSMDWLESFDVKGSLLEDDSFADEVYKRIIKHYSDIKLD